MIGAPHLDIQGKRYDLDWGSSHLSVTGEKADIKIENGRLARMLGAMPLHEFVAKEIKRQA